MSAAANGPAYGPIYPTISYPTISSPVTYAITNRPTIGDVERALDIGLISKEDAEILARRILGLEPKA